MIHGHGDDTYQFAEIKANFSSNVYQQLDLSGLEQCLCQNISAIHSYPEPDAKSLTQWIARKEKVAPAHVCVTNGATEAIYLIAQAFGKGCKTAVLSPVFSEYADACAIHGHQITPIFSLDDLSREADLVWLCNPNNPTGEVYAQEKLLQWVQLYPQTCFVMDHSYAAFTPHKLSEVSEIIQYPNIILLHSMTKYFAIPGLRLGYMCAHANLINKVGRFRMPWSVNQMALKAGEYLLQNEDKLQIDLSTLLTQTRQLQQDLSQISQLEVFPGQTHYFLVRLRNKRTAAALKSYLADEHHILIRDAANFVGLDATYFRVASQTPAHNALLVAAIRTWLE